MATTIPWMRGVTNSKRHFLATVSTPNDHTVEIKPLDEGMHAMTVGLADNVQVGRQLKTLLDKAQLIPPPPGQLLSMAHVNKQVAGMSLDERLEIKNGLLRLGIVELGPKVEIFNRQTHPPCRPCAVAKQRCCNTRGAEMSVFKDLCGREFGMLEVLSLETIGDNGPLWLCRCRCDSLRSVFGRSLLSGHVSSCATCRPPRPPRVLRTKPNAADWGYDPSEFRIGNGGLDSDPLIRLVHRPVALQRSVLRALHDRGLSIGPTTGLDPDAIADLPPAWIAALTAAGLVERVAS